MAIDFNRTIVSARDSKASAEFLAETLGLTAPRKWGPLQMVTTENGANIDFMNTEGEITAQHYAFLVSEPEFDQIFGQSVNDHSRTGRIRRKSSPVRLITTMAGAASIRGSRWPPTGGDYPALRQRRLEPITVSQLRRLKHRPSHTRSTVRRTGPAVNKNTDVSSVAGPAHKRCWHCRSVRGPDRRAVLQAAHRPRLGTLENPAFLH